jgi:hypothetical protein
MLAPLRPAIPWSPAPRAGDFGSQSLLIQDGLPKGCLLANKWLDDSDRRQWSLTRGRSWEGS